MPGPHPHTEAGLLESDQKVHPGLRTTGRLLPRKARGKDWCQLGPFGVRRPPDPVNPPLAGPLVRKARREGDLRAMLSGLGGKETHAAASGLARELLSSPGGEQVYANEAIREQLERVREPGK